VATGLRLPTGRWTNSVITPCKSPSELLSSKATSSYNAQPDEVDDWIPARIVGKRVELAAHHYRTAAGGSGLVLN
jgi:hypothetical protein